MTFGGQASTRTSPTTCRDTKSTKSPSAPPDAEIPPWLFPEQTWSQLHEEFGGFFHGYYLIVVVDAFSKWVEVLPVSTPSARATVPAHRHAFTVQGLLDVMTSDNDPAFTSEEDLASLTKNGIRRLMVPLHCPASNRAGEQVVQTMKDK